MAPTKLHKQCKIIGRPGFSLVYTTCQLCDRRQVLMHCESHHAHLTDGKESITFHTFPTGFMSKKTVDVTSAGG